MLSVAQQEPAKVSFRPIKRHVSPALIAKFDELRLFTTVSPTEKSWLTPGTTVKFDAPVEAEPYSAQRAPAKFCSIGAFSYTRSAFPCAVRIGRYTAIGKGAQVMGVNHSMDRLSMVGFDYSNRSIFAAAKDDFASSFQTQALSDRAFAPPIIGNDVWIGEDVLLAQGIRIGNGAVIAARSVVTKDVPDYTMVAGNPAREKKQRFPESLAAWLLRLRWWEFRFTDFHDMNTLAPEMFAGQLQRRIDKGQIERWSPEPIRIDRLFEVHGT